MPRGAAEIRQVVGATGRGGALEGVGLEPRAVLGGAPLGVEIVERGGHVVGVTVARAKDDGFLLWPARGEEVPEEIARHLGHPLRQEQMVLEGGGIVAGAGCDPP